MASEIKDKSIEKVFVGIRKVLSESEKIDPFRISYRAAEGLKSYLEFGVLQLACADIENRNVECVVISNNTKLIEDFKKEHQIVKSATKKITKSSGQKTKPSTKKTNMNTFNFLTGTTYTFSKRLLYKIISYEAITPENLKNLSEKMKSVSSHYKTNKFKK